MPIQKSSLHLKITLLLLNILVCILCKVTMNLRHWLCSRNRKGIFTDKHKSSCTISSFIISSLCRHSLVHQNEYDRSRPITYTHWEWGLASDTLYSDTRPMPLWRSHTSYDSGARALTMTLAWPTCTNTRTHILWTIHTIRPNTYTATLPPPRLCQVWIRQGS